MFGKRKDPQEEAAIRRLLKSASAEPQNVSLSPYFLSRLKQKMDSSAKSISPSIGNVAWQMIPAMLVMTLLLCCFTGYESWKSAQLKQQAMNRMLSQQDEFAYALTAVFLFGGGGVSQ